MNPDDRRSALVERVELALKTKEEHQKQKKCSVCGRGFLGQDGASTCGDKCRQKKSRG